MARPLILAFLLCSSAGAENFELPVFRGGDWTGGLHLGMALPTTTNRFSDRAGRGAAVSLRLMRYLNGWVGLGAELGTEMFLKHKSPSAPGASGDASYDASGLFFAVLGRVNVFEERSWTPYILGGGGFSRVSVKGSAPIPVCWPVAGTCATDVNGADSGIHLTGGGGIEFFILRGMTMSIEGRFREYRVGGKKLSQSAESLSATLGVSFYF